MRRRPEPAGRPEQKLEQLGLRRPGHGEAHADGLLAPGDPDLVDVLRHAERGLAGDRRLPRVHLLDDADLPLRKKLLRAGAGSSALAVIAPIHPGHARYDNRRCVPPTGSPRCSGWVSSCFSRPTPAARRTRASSSCPCSTGSCPGHRPATSPPSTDSCARGRTSPSTRSSPRSGTARSRGDRKSTRLNSSHGYISYAVFCLKKKKKDDTNDALGSEAPI